MLDFGQAAQDIVCEDELSWKKEVLGPLLTENTGKWRGVLTGWQTALIDSTCGDLMTQYGYRLTGNRTWVSDLVSWPLAWSSVVYRYYRYHQQRPRGVL
jgi:hypothetical protein